MGSIGTFGSFTQARLAIYASQMGLNVTGNNISNINTTGYTRQKLDQEAFRTGGADRYHSSYSIRVGNGVLTTGVSQLRDPYLDIRYRTEMSSVGAMDAKLGGLESIQAVLDEVGDGEDAFGIVEAHLSDLYNAFQQLSDQTGQAEYDIQVRSTAEALTKQLNAYAAKLEEVYQNAEKAFNQDLETVNGILTSIRDLNAAIRKNEIHGDNALELKDERNLLIDKLSEYMKIDVLYTEEDIGAGQTVDKLVIKLANANPDSKVTSDSSTLIDGIFATQFELPEQVLKLNPAFDPTQDASDTNPKYLKDDGITPTNEPNEAAKVPNSNFDLVLAELKNSKGKVLEGSKKVELDDNDLYGALQSERELLTESGEFSDATTKLVDENAATKRGIPYYQHSLNLLANQIAKAFNEANQGFMCDENGNYISVTENGDGTFTSNGPITVEYTDQDGNPATLTLTKNTNWEDIPQEAKAKMLDPNGDPIDSEEDYADYIKVQGGYPMGKPLFSNSGDSDETEGITAANISISDSWSTGPQIVSSFVLPTGMNKIPSTASDNIEHMIYLFSKKMDYMPDTLVADAKPTRMFNGTFQEMWVNIGTVLGNDMKVTQTMLDTYQASSVDLDSSRMGHSSVDLNDEAMNLMQYSKSYNAACRLMTTIDSVLDKLINGTGIT